MLDELINNLTSFIFTGILNLFIISYASYNVISPFALFAHSLKIFEKLLRFAYLRHNAKRISRNLSILTLSSNVSLASILTNCVS